jgi:hypothetical protein
MVRGRRLIRAGVGVVLLLLAAPALIAGAGLGALAGHRSGDGTFSARLEPQRIAGRALVVDDVDEVLRSDAPFARGGRTTLSVSGHGPGGPLFFGLAAGADVDRYLTGVALTKITRVRPARGTLPVETAVVQGKAIPQEPAAKPFWLSTSSGLIRDGRVEDALTWSPSSTRGKHLALVVMNADASAGLDIALLTRLNPMWLVPTGRGLLAFGSAVVLLAFLILAWPRGRRTNADEVEEARHEVPAGGGWPGRQPGALTESAKPLPDPPVFPPLPPLALRFTWPPQVTPRVDA